jgi:prephenate dehydrogenase
VAGSDAALWAGIFLENRIPLLQALDRFETQLDVFRRALEACDEATIRSWWEAARARRGAFDAENVARGIEG